MPFKSKSKRPYPGMGAFVVIINDGAASGGEDRWSAYAGAATMKRARERRRELPQWNPEHVKIVPNQPTGA